MLLRPQDLKQGNSYFSLSALLVYKWIQKSTEGFYSCTRIRCRLEHSFVLELNHILVLIISKCDCPYEVWGVLILVDGGWSSWAFIGACSKSCGGGSRSRRRYCNNPKPAYFGKNCSHLGSDTDTVPCNIHPCPGK